MKDFIDWFRQLSPVQMIVYVLAAGVTGLLMFPYDKLA